MAKTFSELLESRNSAQHERTVYLEVIDFLSQFVRSDVHAPDRVMSTEGLGEVPQDILSKVIKDITTNGLQPAEAIVSTIEEIRVEVPRGKEAIAASTGSKEVSKTGGTGIGRRGLTAQLRRRPETEGPGRNAR